MTGLTVDGEEEEEVDPCIEYIENAFSILDPQQEGTVPVSALHELIWLLGVQHKVIPDPLEDEDGGLHLQRAPEVELLEHFTYSRGEDLAPVTEDPREEERVSAATLYERWSAQNTIRMEPLLGGLRAVFRIFGEYTEDKEVREALPFALDRFEGAG